MKYTFGCNISQQKSQDSACKLLRGARFYDPQIGRFHTQDRFAEKYLDLTPYHYAANNSINFIDVNGDSLIVTKAMLDNKQFAASFKQFMRTKEGMAFLSMYAAKGQTILGHTFDKDGAYSAKEVDLKYDAEDLGVDADRGVTRANTGKYIKENGRLGIGITLNTNKAAASIDENGKTVEFFNQRVYESTENLFHESFIHGSMNTKDFLNNGKMDYSNISQAAKTAAGIFTNQYQHFQVIIDFQNYGYKSRNL